MRFVNNRHCDKPILTDAFFAKVSQAFPSFPKPSQRGRRVYVDYWTSDSELPAALAVAPALCSNPRFTSAEHSRVLKPLGENWQK